MNIAVIVPAYNEARHIKEVLLRMPKTVLGHTVKVLVIDDGSKDDTSTIAESVSGVRVVRHRTNLGKGAAVKTGCDAAYQLGYEIFVLMDSDGQHRPEDIERMITSLVENPSTHQMVIGTRTFSKTMPIAMRLGNKGFSHILRLLFGMNVNDTQSGFRAFARQDYPLLRWISASYAMETEMLILAAQHEMKFAEVPIETIYLDNYKGTTPLDGLRILRTALKWKLLWSRVYKSLEPFSV